MTRTVTFLMLVGLLTALSGCKQEITYSYLMQHSDFLRKESLRCSVSEVEFAEEMAYCDLVHRAMNDFSSMAHIHASQPEKFGRLVMTTEKELVDAEIAIRHAKNAIRMAKERLDENALQEAEKQWQEAKKLHAERQEELSILFSILRAYSPA